MKSLLGAPRITEQPLRHGSSARYVRDPMTQGYRPGGACFLIFGLLIFGLVFVLTRGLKGQRDVNGAPHTWAEKIYVGHKILMKPSHDCSY